MPILNGTTTRRAHAKVQSKVLYAQRPVQQMIIPMRRTITSQQQRQQKNLQFNTMLNNASSKMCLSRSQNPTGRFVFSRPLISPSNSMRGGKIPDFASQQRQTQSSPPNSQVSGFTAVKPKYGARDRKLVVLGTGWGGFRLAKEIKLAKNDPSHPGYQLNIISPRNHFLFTPLLPSTCTGTIEFRGISEPIRTARNGLNYIQFQATKIDPEQKIVYASSYYPAKGTDEAAPIHREIKMRYDDLVIAVGAKSNTFGIPGVEKYCFFMKQLSDARLVRNRILECFERASDPTLPREERERLLHFVVVGGGPTSVEVVASIYDFVHSDVPTWFPELKSMVQVSLLEAGKTLLGAFDSRLGEKTAQLFTKRHIDVRTNIAVKEVHRHHMVLTDGNEIPFGLAVWSTGNAPLEFTQSLPFEKDRSGRIVVNEYLQVVGRPDIYAIGDCATLADRNLPPTAQVAQQQGKYLGKLLNERISNTSVSLVDLKTGPFVYKYRGVKMLAYVGSWRALVDTPNAKFSGVFAWLFYNSAYFTMLVSWRNKIMIPMYWFKSFIFGRDISRF